MRILFVSDEYPPFDRGGYAQLCYELAHGLRHKGHSVTILCSKTVSNHSFQEKEAVIRDLYLPVNFEANLPAPLQQLFWVKARHQHNLQVFKQVLNDKRPEFILFWPNFYFDYYLMLEAEQLADVPVGYYIAGFSPTQPTPLVRYWSHRGQSRPARLIKGLLRPFLAPNGIEQPPLGMQRVMCVSEYERQRIIQDGVSADNAVVVYNGIDPYQFYFRGLPSTRRKPNELLKVLYIGRLVETKGGHTLINAIKELRQINPNLQILTTLLGTGPDTYVKYLEKIILENELSESVELRSWIQRDKLPEFMADYDVLVLPTIHPEPLARAVQEAMAMGLIVVATPTGGTPEVVYHEKSGLTFSPGHPTELADCLRRLYSDLILCDNLAEAGYQLVKSKFTIQTMVNTVECKLGQWINTTRKS